MRGKIQEDAGAARSWFAAHSPFIELMCTISGKENPFIEDYKELQELEEAICRFYQEDILPLEARQDVLELQTRDEGFRRF